MIGLLLVACWAAAPCVVAAPGAAGQQEPLDINGASLEQLKTLPGVGDVIARRIVDFRQEHGPFRRVEDLMRVKGIGEKSLERLRPYIKVGKAK
jgi:competence protein ComEA